MIHPNCDHVCSGNCRRVGCNCECGEWHGEQEVDMTPPANEWREELRTLMQMEEMPVLEDFIQNLLDQHSAGIVERIENMAIVDDYGEERKIGFQIAKDQAIDIIKDNK